jgi:hypothetical protein
VRRSTPREGSKRVDQVMTQLLRRCWLDPSVPTITHFTARIPDDLITDSPR